MAGLSRRLAGAAAMALVWPLLTGSMAAGNEAQVAYPTGRWAGTFWITDRQGDQVAVYDASTGALLTVQSTKGPNDPSTPDEPNDVAIAGGKAYVTNEASGTISVFDVATMQPIGRLGGAGPKPHHAATSPNGRYVAYGVYGAAEVGLIDSRTDTIRRLPASNRAGEVFTHSASFSSSGRTVYVANEVKSGSVQLVGTVAAIDLTTGTISCEIDVGVRPSEVVVLPHSDIGYASVRNEHMVKEVDFGSCALTGRAVDLTEEVDTLWLARGGGKLSVGLRGPAPKPARVAMIDLRHFTSACVRFWTIPGGTLTGHQWTSWSGRYTAASFEGDGAGVAIIDHARDSVLKLPTIGPARPHGMAFARQESGD
jgi:DNA-binding beta-propeller fold protein YncE